MRPLAYKLRFAWKTITGNFGNSLSVLLSLILTAMLLVIAFNLRSGFEKTFYYKNKETYKDIDIVITYDENATARLVNKRKLTTDYSDQVRPPLAFFNLFVLAGATEDTFYTELMSSSIAEMEKLIDYDMESLTAGQIAITKSLAKKHALAVGQPFRILMLGGEYEYMVAEIIPDTGLFSGDKVFVEKNRLLNDFYGLSGFDNLGNTIYIDVLAETDVDALIAILSADAEYADYLIFKTIDQEAIISKSRYNSTIMLGLTVLVLIALGMVIHSLFPLLARNLQRQYGLIRILGGNDRFVFSVWLIEIFIFYTMAVAAGCVFAFLVINFSSRSYGVLSIIGLDILMTVLALISLAALLLIESGTRFANIRKQSLIALSSDIRYHRSVPQPYWFIVFVALAGIIHFTQPFSYPVNALIMILTGIFAAFTGITIVLHLCQKLAFKGKPRLFERFNLRYLRDNRYIHHSLRILLASFLVIVIALAIRVYIRTETATFKNQLGFDYAIANIFDYDPALLDEITAEFPVTHASAMAFSNQAYFALDDSGESKLFTFCVMMPFADFLRSFAFPITSQPSEELLAANQAFVMLPDDYRYTHLLAVGDTVIFQTDGGHGDIELVVGGFFEVSYPNIIYTNLPAVPDYADGFRINTVIIETDEELLLPMAEKYGEAMYYVVPIEQLIARYGDLFQAASDLIVVLVGVIVASFLIVIVNNTLLLFQTLKSDYAKLKTLGVRNRQLYSALGLEALLCLLVVGLFFVPEIHVMTTYLPKLMLFFQYHREIIPQATTVVFGTVLVAFAFGGSYLVYLRKIKNLDLIGEIKYE